MTVGQVTVGVDVGSHMHRVAIGTPEKKIAEEFDLPHNKEGFKKFFERISHYENTFKVPVIVAMEGFNGYARPLDQIVQKKGYRLLNVNNLKLCRFKEIFPSPAKTDAIDARREKGVRPTQLTEWPAPRPIGLGYAVTRQRSRGRKDGQIFVDRIPRCFLSCYLKRQREEGYFQKRSRPGEAGPSSRRAGARPCPSPRHRQVHPAQIRLSARQAGESHPDRPGAGRTAFS